MVEIEVFFCKRRTNQQYENRGLGRQLVIVAGNPIESRAAAVLGAEALSLESYVRGGVEEGGNDGLHMAVGGDDWVSIRDGESFSKPGGTTPARRSRCLRVKGGEERKSVISHGITGLDGEDCFGRTSEIAEWE
ncbi:unnamed protein product [Linum trigynum]|uniref:Uncharacterized protein n=1 Tax=Linum trigynum TaxID=586398 RepID=A0AAV2FQ80_9ROSI